MSQTVLKELQSRLSSDLKVDQLTPEQQDVLLENVYSLGMHERLLGPLADHYEVNYRDLKDLLVARQLVYVHMMTDYTKPSDPEGLQTILKQQASKTTELLERMNSMVSRVNETLRQVELIRDEAARVLAIYKAKYVQDSVPNPK